jgi:hypothetical protein
MTYSSGLRVLNSQRINLAAHSGTIQQLVTKNCDERPSPKFLFFRSPTSFQRPSTVCVVAGFCVCSVESVEGVWGIEEFGFFRTGENVSYRFDRMTRRILSMLKVKWANKQSINQAVFPISFICPVICIFRYEVSTDQCHCPDTAANCT